MVAFQRIDQTEKCGSVGKPLEDVAVKVVDDAGRSLPDGERGELCVSGPNVFKGYYKRDNETGIVLREGWLSTGDIAAIDPDGDLYIVDRKKELINRGGYKVYPREVEAVLYKILYVREAAVFGVSDPRLGEEIKAVISIDNKAFVANLPVIGDENRPDDLTKQSSISQSAIVESVQAFCKEKLAAYKWPRIIEIIEVLPKTSTGKISKKLLR